VEVVFHIALFRRLDQYHREARAWQNYLVRSGALLITNGGVCWEWLFAPIIGTRPGRNLCPSGGRYGWSGSDAYRMAPSGECGLSFPGADN
jgi:hypothetical protein